jgi:DNA-binding response OmpR family regulator
LRTEILVVDDSLTVRMDLERALTSAGYAVTTCSTLAAARDNLRRHPFGLLILDVRLPDGDGIELLGELKDAPEHAAIPVILLSTEAEVRSRVRGLSTGAQEYVGKPYDASYILKRIHHLIDPSPGPHEPQAPERGVGDKKILVVGGPSTFFTVLAERLRLDRHDVVLAHSDEEAAQLLSVTAVDGIIVDSMTPGADGIATARRLKGVPGRETIPVVMLASSAAPGLEERARAAGVDEVLVRPESLTSVRAALRALLRKKQHEKDWARRSGPPPAARPLAPKAPPPLFGQVVAASGLPALLARSSLDRACRSAGVDVQSMTPGDLERALPAIREALLIFMTPSEAAKCVDAMAALARPGGPSAT